MFGQDAGKVIVAMHGFGRHIKIFLDLRAFPGFGAQGGIQVTTRIALIKLLGRPALNVHVHQKHIPVAGLRKRSRQPGGNAAHAGARGCNWSRRRVWDGE